MKIRMYLLLHKRLLSISSALALVSLLAAGGTLLATGAHAAGSSTITLTAVSSSAPVGDSVTLIATVVDGNSQAISGVTVTFSTISGPDTGPAGSATTDTNGQAFRPLINTFKPGVDVAQASFTDPTTQQTLTSNQVQVNWLDNSSITLSSLQGNVLPVGMLVSVVAAVLGVDGLPARATNVNFSVTVGPDAGLVGTATTDTNGQAIFTFTNTGGIGTDVIQASFIDSAETLQTGQFLMNWFDASSITLSASPTTAPLNTMVTLTATATGADGVQSAVGVNVTFAIISGPNGGNQFNAATNASGQATVSINDGNGPGTDMVQASFTDSLGSTRTSIQIAVHWGNQSSISLVPPTTTRFVGFLGAATANVIGADGLPANGASVTFTVISGPDQGLTRTIVADSSGTAIFTFVNSSAAGTDVIQASFTDSLGVTWTSNQEQLLWIDDSSAALSATPTTQKLGTSVSATASVTGDDGNPAAGVTVTFSVVSGPDAGQTGTATTDANGNASFSLTDTTRAGTDVLQASFTDVVTNQAITSNQVQVTWVGLTVTSQAVSAIEGSQFSGTLATITGALDVPSASIDWGDGTTSAGTITANADGSFSVSGTHTYLEEGSYNVTISAQDSTGASANATSTATVADAILGFDAVKVSSWAPKSEAAEVTFNDHDPNGTLSDYQATINWGDGTTTTARIRLATNGQIYIINGTHVYSKAGTYTVAVTVQDSGGSTATTTQTITVH